MIGEGTLVGLAALDPTLPDSSEPTWSIESDRTVICEMNH
jgi:hypothetical protein